MPGFRKSPELNRHTSGVIYFSSLVNIEAGKLAFGNKITILAPILLRFPLEKSKLAALCMVLEYMMGRQTWSFTLRQSQKMNSLAGSVNRALTVKSKSHPSPGGPLMRAHQTYHPYLAVYTIPSSVVCRQRMFSLVQSLGTPSEITGSQEIDWLQAPECWFGKQHGGLHFVL